MDGVIEVITPTETLMTLPIRNGVLMFIVEISLPVGGLTVVVRNKSEHTT